MKKTFIDIRDRANGARVIRTYTFRGDVSIIVSSMSTILVIEQEFKKNNTIDLADNEAYSVRNWG